jgi:hypothetical protein
MCAEATAYTEVETAAPDVQRKMARCRTEIAAVIALLQTGHPDVEGLCLALADWSAQLRILEKDPGRTADAG